MSDWREGCYFSGPTSTSVVFPAVEAEICDGLSVRESVEVPLEPDDKVVYLAPDGTTYGVHHRGTGSTS